MGISSISLFLYILPLISPFTPLPPVSAKEHGMCISDALNITPINDEPPPLPPTVSAARTSTIPDNSFDVIRVNFYPTVNAPQTPNDIATYKLLVEELLPAAGHVFRRSLRMKKPLTPPPKIPYNCDTSASRDGEIVCTSPGPPPLCITTPIQTEHMTPMLVCNKDNLYDCETLPGGDGLVNTDVLMYVDWGEHSYCTEGVLAFAGACRLFGGVPFMGSIFLCPLSLDLNNRKAETTIQTIVHEALHVLGIATNLFKYFKDDEGNDRNPFVNGVYVDNTVVMRDVGDENMYYVSTERAREYMREMTGCESAQGVGLENVDNNAGSHVEQLMHQEDLMVAVEGDNGGLSNATLTILRDSGWFAVNYETAWNTMYGHHSVLENGCGFAKGVCFEDGVSVSSDIFCTEEQLGCALNRDVVKMCDVDVDTMKGWDPHISACPVYSFDHMTGVSKYMRCEYSEQNPLFAHKGASFGSSARCMLSSLVTSGSTSTDAMCYETTCESKRGEEFINEWRSVAIGVHAPDGTKKTVVCTSEEEGVLKAVEGFDGGITCPSVLQTCWNRPCMNRGSPKYGMCQCQGSHFGLYCQHYRSIENLSRYISDLHYGDLQHVALVVGRSYEIPSSVSGGVRSFVAVNPLPEGLSLAADGSIVGRPTEASSCLPYTIAAKGEVEDDQSRVVVFIEVLKDVPMNGRPKFSNCDKLLLEFQPDESNRTLVDAEEVNYMNGIYGKWMDIRGDVRQHYRQHFIVEDPHGVATPFIPVAPSPTTPSPPTPSPPTPSPPTPSPPTPLEEGSGEDILFGLSSTEWLIVGVVSFGALIGMFVLVSAIKRHNLEYPVGVESAAF